MSFKVCAYKNCENYTINGVPAQNRNFTLFQLPKDPERRKRWMKYAHFPPNLPASGMLICSQHFDRKYLSLGNRRTILVGPAVPFVYNQRTTMTSYTVEAEDEESKIESQEEDLGGKEEDFINSEDFESSTMPEDEHWSFMEAESEVCKQHDPSSEKRKADPSSPPSGSRKRLNKLQVIESEITSAANKAATSEHNDTGAVAKEETIAAVDTRFTTFIFKDEEYVQMPKDYYMREKLELLRKIQKYEAIIKSVREKVNVLD